MTLEIILMVIGIGCILASLFIKPKSANLDMKIENVSIAMHEQMNDLQKRMRVIEDEMLIPQPLMPQRTTKLKRQKQTTEEPVHAIIVSQILALYQQGYDLPEIAKRSSLSEAKVTEVLRSKGALV